MKHSSVRAIKIGDHWVDRRKPRARIYRRLARAEKLFSDLKLGIENKQFRHCENLFRELDAQLDKAFSVLLDLEKEEL